MMNSANDSLNLSSNEGNDSSSASPTPAMDGDKFMIARSDGLYTYSTMDKISVSPIDGSKMTMSSVPPHPTGRRRYHPYGLLKNQRLSTSLSQPSLSGAPNDGESKIQESTMENMVMNGQSADSGTSYTLIATTDSKSGRDAVDIYDITNKLIAFHMLYPPGFRATSRAAGTTTAPNPIHDVNTRGGLSSAVVITSGGSLVTLTENMTSDKVSLLVQKNLYTAAISMAFADPSYQPSDITALFRRHAEHLYRKHDFAAAMDQYIYTSWLLGTIICNLSIPRCAQNTIIDKASRRVEIMGYSKLCSLRTPQNMLFEIE